MKRRTNRRNRGNSGEEEGNRRKRKREEEERKRESVFSDLEITKKGLRMEKRNNYLIQTQKSKSKDFKENSTVGTKNKY